MTTITALQGTDGITAADSMVNINQNFANLNSDKIETSVLDTDTALTANSDAKVATQKAVKAYADGLITVSASETVKGAVEEATDAEITAGTATGGTGAKLFITPAKLKSAGVVKFGGTGADGALSITSGTTTIDLGSAAVVTKNYTSISITGTGALAFSNPHANGTLIILKSQGNVTITSSANPTVDLRSLGGTGGTAGSSGGGTGGTGSTGNSSLIAMIGGGSGGTSASNNGVGGAGGVTIFNGSTLKINGKLVPFGCGSGGAGGAGSAASQPGGGGGGGASLITNGTVGETSTNGGAAAGAGAGGGRGGGALYIECGGALNITSVFNASGAAGSAASASGGSYAGGGGGGGGGTIVILYQTLTANTGTYTVTGGSGGAGAITNTDGGAGAAGTSLVAANTEFA